MVIGHLKHSSKGAYMITLLTILWSRPILQMENMRLWRQEWSSPVKPAIAVGSPECRTHTQSHAILTLWLQVLPSTNMSRSLDRRRLLGSFVVVLYFVHPWVGFVLLKDNSSGIHSNLMPRIQGPERQGLFCFHPKTSIFFFLLCVNIRLFS